MSRHLDDLFVELEEKYGAVYASDFTTRVEEIIDALLDVAIDTDLVNAQIRIAERKFKKESGR